MIMSNPLDGNQQEGDQLGRYRLVAVLGQGGMGRIYLAVTSGLGEFRKLLVVKELQQELARNERFVEMFLAEAKLAARLNHPNIVQTIEAGEENGRYFLSMEFLEGQPLTELLKRATVEPVVTLATRLQILCEVLSALQYAHELCDFDGTPFQIVHRDITPHNVFVTYHGQVKLVDFGIAKAVDVESLTSAGVFKGKFAYAAPEQVRGEVVDQRSDLFAVGVMLWEAIAMRRFASGPPTRLSIDKRIRGIEPRIIEAVPTVEPALAEICDRALHIDRDQRFSSASEFRAALQRYLLVAGEDPPQPLGPLLCTKFVAERDAMHRMIDAYAKRDDRNQSVVRSLSTMAEGLPRQAASHEDGPTRVGNLARLIESSRVDNPVAGDPAPFEWGNSLRSKPRVYPWIVGGAVAVIGVLLLLLRNGEPPAKAPHLALPAPPSAAPKETVIAPATSPEMPAAWDARAAAPQPSAAADSGGGASTSPRDVATERPARQWRTRTASDDSSSASTRSHDPAKSSSATSAHSREPVSGITAADNAHDDSAAVASGVSRNPYRAPSPNPTPGSADERSLSPARAVQPSPRPMTAGSSLGPEGQDLRNLPRRAPRPIDTEDPFR
jgi:tRNA A-37 threonylcarbamoyl transferase component Bud32